MTNAGQPPGIEERLSRLERLFANVGETVLVQSANINAQSNTIDLKSLPWLLWLNQQVSAHNRGEEVI